MYEIKEIDEIYVAYEVYEADDVAVVNEVDEGYGADSVTWSTMS